MNYSEWIQSYADKHTSVLGRCKEASTEMVEASPELTMVPGHAYPLGGGKEAHWWCKDPDGMIVDPTAKQYGSVMEYEEWKPDEEVRVGKCMNCGEEIWKVLQSLDNVKTESLCSQTCAKEFGDGIGETIRLGT